jgi:hypothetical protein
VEIKRLDTTAGTQTRDPLILPLPKRGSISRGGMIGAVLGRKQDLGMIGAVTASCEIVLPPVKHNWGMFGADCL